MGNDIQRVVGTVFCDVIERLAFMFGEPCDKDDLPGGQAHASTTMTFSGPWQGTLELVVPTSLCAQIASNVLGTEPEDEESTRFQEDAVKEVLNVTCGNILTELAGPDPVFDLSVPTFTALDQESWELFRDDPESVGLLVEDEPVLIRLAVAERIEI